MERVKGIEPSSQAWEAHILPLNHTRVVDAKQVTQMETGPQLSISSCRDSLKMSPSEPNENVPPFEGVVEGVIEGWRF